MKDLGHHGKVKIGNIKNCIPYNPQTKRCLLCLNKKLEIAAYQEHSILIKTRHHIKMSTPVEVHTG